MKFVVQSFRPGASRIWNDEAWSYSREKSERYVTDARQRSPEVKWRLVTQYHPEVCKMTFNELVSSLFSEADGTVDRDLYGPDIDLLYRGWKARDETTGTHQGGLTMKRKMTEEDLRDKGLPFECNNCGRKPPLDEVLEHGGECQLCGDEVFAYTIDTARLLKTLMPSSAPAAIQE